MRRVVHRPVGIAVLAALLAIKGVASIAMAADLLTFDLGRSTNADAPPAGVALVIGLMFLYKTYGLWMLHYGAWLLMLAFVVIDGCASVAEILIGTHTATAWISFALVVATGLYLLRPGVRSLFSERHAAS